MANDIFCHVFLPDKLTEEDENQANIYTYVQKLKIGKFYHDSSIKKEIIEFLEPLNLEKKI